MASGMQINRPRIGSIALALVVLIGMGAGVFLIGSSVAKLGIFQTAVLTFGYLVGAIFGQAKDIANQQQFSGSVWQDLRAHFAAAWSNEHSAAFVFRSLEWGGLLIAGTFVAKLLAG